MFLFGVINASPDSLNTDSIVRTAQDATNRATGLLGEGCNGFDLGGQGSTGIAGEADPDTEWERLAPVIPALVAHGVPISVDTWRPMVARRALDAGVTWLNAAEGLQTDEMIAVVAERRCPVVLPFLNGPDPLNLEHISPGFDPVKLLIEFFENRLDALRKKGITKDIVIDPGTGFAPHNWDWSDRFLYQKEVYGRLGELRRFGLPLYIALPWRRTAQHDELLEIVVSQHPEYGRVHYPAVVREAEARAADAARASAADR